MVHIPSPLSIVTKGGFPLGIKWLVNFLKFDLISLLFEEDKGCQKL